MIILVFIASSILCIDHQIGVPCIALAVKLERRCDVEGWIGNRADWRACGNAQKALTVDREASTPDIKRDGCRLVR